MGRRALRQFDRCLDLSRHLKDQAQLPSPLDAAALFGRVAPLEIEVGSGKGMFLAAASGDHAERNFLGIEIARRYARFAAAKLARQQRANALLIHGDAAVLFGRMLPDQCASAVHVYFPDPWWKTRHRKRRVINEVFVAHVERTLQAGGLLHFWTDVEEYYRWTLELMANSTSLQGPQDVPELPSRHDLDYQTHFERRMRLQHRPIYRALFRR